MNTLNNGDAKLNGQNEDAGRVNSKHESVTEPQQDSQRKPGLIRRFIDKLAEDNTQALGSSRLDCCDLNKNNR